MLEIGRKLYKFPQGTQHACSILEAPREGILGCQPHRKSPEPFLAFLETVESHYCLIAGIVYIWDPRVNTTEYRKRWQGQLPGQASNKITSSSSAQTTLRVSGRPREASCTSRATEKMSNSTWRPRSRFAFPGKVGERITPCLSVLRIFNLTSRPKCC